MVARTVGLARQGEASRVVSRNSIISGDISERKYPRGKHKDRIRNERKVIQLW